MISLEKRDILIAQLDPRVPVFMKDSIRQEPEIFSVEPTKPEFVQKRSFFESFLQKRLQEEPATQENSQKKPFSDKCVRQRNWVLLGDSLEKGPMELDEALYAILNPLSDYLGIRNHLTSATLTKEFVRSKFEDFALKLEEQLTPTDVSFSSSKSVSERLKSSKRISSTIPYNESRQVSSDIQKNTNTQPLSSKTQGFNAISSKVPAAAGLSEPFSPTATDPIQKIQPVLKREVAVATVAVSSHEVDKSQMSSKHLPPIDKKLEASAKVACNSADCFEKAISTPIQYKFGSDWLEIPQKNEPQPRSNAITTQSQASIKSQSKIAKGAEFNPQDRDSKQTNCQKIRTAPLRAAEVSFQPARFEHPYAEDSSQAFYFSQRSQIPHISHHRPESDQSRLLKRQQYIQEADSRSYFVNQSSFVSENTISKTAKSSSYCLRS